MLLSCLSDKVRRARTDSALTAFLMIAERKLVLHISLQDRRWFILQPGISTNFSLFTPWTTYTGMLCATHPRVNSHHQPIINYASFLSCARSNSINSCERFDPFPLLPSCCTTQSGPKSGFWRCDSGLPHAQNKLPKEIN